MRRKFAVGSLPRIGSPVGQRLVDLEFLRNKIPILLEPFKFADKIGENIPVMIDKPIELVAMRRRMDTVALLYWIQSTNCSNVILSLIAPLLCAHKASRPCPRDSKRTRTKVGLELLTPGAASVLLWQCEIKNFQRPVRSPAHMRPIILHLTFDLPQIQVVSMVSPKLPGRWSSQSWELQRKCICVCERSQSAASHCILKNSTGTRK